MYIGHSVLFYFKRSNGISLDARIQLDARLNAINKNYSLETFYGNIHNNISRCNALLMSNVTCRKYIWPASIHSMYLFIFGLNEKLLDGMLDNSSNKIGKKMYGSTLEIFSFNQILENNDDHDFIIINGGIFNHEIENKLRTSKIKFLII